MSKQTTEKEPRIPENNGKPDLQTAVQRLKSCMAILDKAVARQKK